MSEHNVDQNAGQMSITTDGLMMIIAKQKVEQEILQSRIQLLLRQIESMKADEQAQQESVVAETKPSVNKT